MKYTIEQDFAKHVKGPEQHRVYLLHGSESYLIDLYRKLLVKKAVDGALNDFNYHQFEGATLNLQALYDAVESLPLVAQSRCVWLDADLDKLSGGEVTELCSVLSDPPATTTVIVTLQTPPSKKEKLTALVKTCDKAGAVAELGGRTSSDLSRFLRDRAQRAGCELTGDCAGYLIERCGGQMQLLATELDKLCAYAAGRKITKTDIDEVVAAVLQARVYDLSKAILRGNYNRALALCDQLIELREPVARVLSVLSMAFVDLYRGFAARQAAAPPGQAAEELGYPKNRAFAIKNAMAESAGYTAPQLGRMLEALAEADFALKSTGTDERIALEGTITKLFLLTGRH